MKDPLIFVNYQFIIYICSLKIMQKDTIFEVKDCNTMIINREHYINELLSVRWNGKTKIITGIRRSGKSFLLSTLYKMYLQAEGVPEDSFIEIALDRQANLPYRNPIKLYEFILSKIKDPTKKYYVFIDEIQLCYKVKNSDIDEKMVPEEDRDLLFTTFYDTLNDLTAIPNVDVYVTGSNSKMLSTDLVTNFRDRGSEVRVYPLSFSEYYQVSGMEKGDAFEEYITYGGMPLAVLADTNMKKVSYLKNLFRNVYIKDIRERYHLRDDEVLDALIDALCSSVGNLTNPHKLAATAESLMRRKTSDATVKNYLDYLVDSFLFLEAKRYDVKGRKYFDNIKKFYAMDIGLRNARLNFRQQERSHIMENVIYNELIRRGYSVDVGVVEIRKSTLEGKKQSQYEIDFIVNTGKEKVYIQSALNVTSKEKYEQETFSLKNSGDFFRKIIIVDGNSKLWIDNQGITFVGVIPFLLGEDNIGGI